MIVPSMKSDAETQLLQINVGPALLIPACSADGRISAIHTKPHREEDDDVPKYMWASSGGSFKLYPPDSEDGQEWPEEWPEREDPLFVCRANKSVVDSVALIEGGLKAYVFAYQLSSKQLELHGWVVGAAGGQFWQNPCGFFHAMAGVQPSTFVLYPDAGSVENENVLLAYFRTFDMLQDHYLESNSYMSVAVAWWGQRFKHNHLDADDFLLQGGNANKMRQISIPAFWGKVPAGIQRNLMLSRHGDLFRSVLDRSYCLEQA